MKKTTTILAIGSGLLFSHAQAEIESEFHVGYNSKYLFRGVDFGDDAYEYGLDFAGSSDLGFDWSAGIWGISPDGEDGNTDELDFYAAVSKTFGGATVSAGFTVYTFDSSSASPAGDDAEVFLGVAGDIYGVEAGVNVYFGTDGTYQEQILIEVSLGYSFAVTDTVEGNVGLTYGAIADDGSGGYSDGNGGAYFSASFGLDFSLSEQITFSPYVSYVDGAERVGGVTEEVIGGASLSFSF